MTLEDPVKHYVIESYNGFKTVKRFTDTKCVWHTTSPFLLRQLPRDGEEVYSLEENVSVDEMNRLAKACHEICANYCQWLNTKCGWRKYADLEIVFSGTLFRCLYTTLYKGMLLQRLRDSLKTTEGETEICCVGNSTLTTVTGFSIMHQRLDTLFAVIAEKNQDKRLSVFEHNYDQEDIDKLEKYVFEKPMARAEKLLSILSNTPGSFCYRIWKNLKSRGGWGLRHVGIWPWPKKHFYFYKECELLGETFLKILLKGGWVGLLEKISSPGNRVADESDMPGHEKMEKHFVETVQSTVTVYGLPAYDICATCSTLVFQRLLTVLNRLRCDFSQLTEKFEAVLAPLEKNAIILTSAVNDPLEKLFFSFCRKKQQAVAAYEHGVTRGLASWTQYCTKHSSMGIADVGVYNSQVAADMMAAHTPEQQRLVAGLPQVTAKIFGKGLQKWIVKKWLNLHADGEIIMYVADLEHNNFLMGPDLENDLQYLKQTKAITVWLAESFPQSTVILKLYPTMRYQESYDFSDLEERYANLKIIKEVDFRFIRSLADRIFVTSSQSTLGWVLGAGVPVVYLDFAWAASTVPGVKLDLPPIEGLMSAIMVDHGAFLQNPTPDCISPLFDTQVSA